MAISALFAAINALLFTILIWHLKGQFRDPLQVIAGAAHMLGGVFLLIALSLIFGYAGFTIAAYFSVFLLALGAVVLNRLQQHSMARVLGGSITLWAANAVHGFILINYGLLIQGYK